MSGYLSSANIPNSVTSIDWEAFYECSSLTNVTIGNSVNSIGDGAFYNCSNLTNVTIGSSVKSIGDIAFFNCSSLMSVTIGSSVKSIGNRAIGYLNSYNANSTKIDGFIIYGHTGSEAERYATENSFTFIPLIIMGDIDGDGVVEIRDTTWIQRHVAEVEMPLVIDKTTADVDGDGIITVMDATAIQYYLANMKTSYKIGEKIE